MRNEIINVKSTTEFSGIYVVYDGSTHNERAGIYGISHLMEHLVCKSFDHLQNDFDRYSIDWNAYTTDEQIVFYMTGLEECVGKFREEYINGLGTFNITEEQFEMERKIVLQEYDDYFAQPAWNYMMNLSRALFGSYGAIGKRSDIESLTFEDAKNYFELQYSKPSRIINISKTTSFSPDSFELAEPHPMSTPIVPISDPELLELPKQDFDNQTIVNLSEVMTEDFGKLKILCKVLGGGLQSPLYQEIREKKGLVYYVRCQLSPLGFDKGVISIQSETQTENIDAWYETLSNILDKKSDFITQERLDIVKEGLRVQLKKQDILNYGDVGRFMTPEEWQIRPILESTTLEDLHRLTDLAFRNSLNRLEMDKINTSEKLKNEYSK